MKVQPDGLQVGDIQRVRCKTQINGVPTIFGRVMRSHAVVINVLAQKCYSLLAARVVGTGRSGSFAAVSSHAVGHTATPLTTPQMDPSADNEKWSREQAKVIVNTLRA